MTAGAANAIDHLEIPNDIAVSRGDLANAVGGAPDTSTASARDVADIRLGYGPSQRADDHRPMIQLLQPWAARDEKAVWLDHALEAMVGSSDQAKGIATGDAAMTAAHERAVAELSVIRERFAKGLRTGETLFVKHGFPIADGLHEYMWIAVVRWSGGRLAGQLANTPRHRPDLTSGQTVEISEADVYDWMLQLPGDNRLGGYTIDVTLSEGKEL